MNHKYKGMSIEMYEHIRDNLHTIDFDLQKGVLLYRQSNQLRSGYPSVRLKCKHVYNHQIFAVARWGEKCIGMTVNHINENKLDNSWDNLELLSMVDNIKAYNSCK